MRPNVSVHAIPAFPSNILTLVDGVSLSNDHAVTADGNSGPSTAVNPMPYISDTAYLTTFPCGSDIYKVSASSCAETVATHSDNIDIVIIFFIKFNSIIIQLLITVFSIFYSTLCFTSSTPSICEIWFMTSCNSAEECTGNSMLQ